MSSRPAVEREPSLSASSAARAAPPAASSANCIMRPDSAQHKDCHQTCYQFFRLKHCCRAHRLQRAAVIRTSLITSSTQCREPLQYTRARIHTWSGASHAQHARRRRDACRLEGGNHLRLARRVAGAAHPDGNWPPAGRHSTFEKTQWGHDCFSQCVLMRRRDCAGAEEPRSTKDIASCAATWGATVKLTSHRTTQRAGHPLSRTPRPGGARPMAQSRTAAHTPGPPPYSTRDIASFTPKNELSPWLQNLDQHLHHKLMQAVMPVWR